MPVVAEPERATVDDLRALYRDLHQLGIDLREASLSFQDFVRAGLFAESGRTFEYSPDDPTDRLNRSIDITREFEFLVAVTGAFSSGKSTLLNLLLGQRDLLPASVIPMTAVCTVIRYGDSPRLQVRYVEFEQCFDRVRAHLGTELRRPFTAAEHLRSAADNPRDFVADPDAAASLARFADLLLRYDEIRDHPVWFDVRAPFIAGGGVLRDADGTHQYFSPTPQEEQDYLSRGGDPRRWVSKEWLALIRDVSLWVPSPLLENDIVLLDLPGLNCREDYHRRAIREYCNMADCVLVTAFQPGNQADAEVIEGFKKLSANYRDKVFFVFNKVDQFAGEPQELARAVDYLGRDTIGSDFPRDRFFLTSARLCRESQSKSASWRQDLERLRDSFTGVAGALPGLDSWVARVVSDDDPGGVVHLRDNLCAFLVRDAYPTKVAEVLQSYSALLDSLRGAAAPHFDEASSMDAGDVLRRSVLEYYRHVEGLLRDAVRQFRSEYLRGHESDGTPTLRSDLNVILEQAHGRAHEMIRNYFDRPILTAPLVEDPISEFDLLTIADCATRDLRRELQELVIESVYGRVRAVFRELLAGGGGRQHLERALRGAPQWQRRAEAIFSRFEHTVLHSHKCIVGARFFHMPRGRRLKRLEQAVPLARMKAVLVEVFADFYPSWIYENVYAELIDRLWLAIYLDCEDLEQELSDFFRASEGVVTRLEVAERVSVPSRLNGEAHGMYQSIRMCQRIAGLLDDRAALVERAANLGVRS